MIDKKSIDSLRSEIQECNLLYRIGTPKVSDAEYDKMVDELRLVNPNDEWFNSIEPSPVSSPRKKKLPIPMKSLNKVKSVAELQRWIKSLGLPLGTKLTIMPKYDGISWLHDEYNNTTYSRGGSENEGQDCTEHFIAGGFTTVTEGCFPARYTFGELLFSCANWEEKMSGRISDSTGEPYRSPRNTVAGFINRDVPPADISNTTFVRYGVDEESLENWSKFSSLICDLNKHFGGRSNGENVDSFMPCHTMTVKNLNEETLHEIFKIYRRHYYVDGLVVYLDDLNLWKAIGRQNTTGNPLYAVAYKHPDFTDTFETTVKGIQWKVSKAGALKPVVQIEAVDTGDCIMENPTGYNARWIVSNGIGIGARILVTRSGGVIPKILETLSPAEVELPRMCPSCGAEIVYNPADVELMCNNPACQGRQLAKIVHFFKIAGAENMGEETICKIFNAGHRTVRAFLDLTFDALLSVDGFGEASTNDILAQMKRFGNEMDLATLMHASNCFKGVGRTKAQAFLDSLSFTGLVDFSEGRYFLTKPDIESRAFKVATVTYQNIWSGYDDFVQFLKDTCIKPTIQIGEKATSTKFENFAVCFSGVRDAELESVIKAGSGTIASGVSRKTTHLIVKDPNGSSSKITKAQGLGIAIQTIEEFKAQYGI